MSTITAEAYISSPYHRQDLLLILTVFIFIFSIIAFFSVYYWQYITNMSWLHRQPTNTGGVQALRRGGLHPSIVASFPTFTYALVKDYRQGRCSLECAVCLSEFVDDDILRLPMVCKHVFHAYCIDLWLAFHTTCPVCRQNLDPAEKSPEKTPEVRVSMPETDEREEAVEEEEEAREESGQRNSFKEEEEGRDSEDCAAAHVASERREHVVTIDRLPRSHSTGHSLIEDERFTLRLPENVKKRITRERNSTGSCIAFEDLSNNDRIDADMMVVVECSDFPATCSQRP